MNPAYLPGWLQSPLVILLLLAWTVPWKGVALWRAARNRQHWWFVALLVVNTLAILEIVYIFAFSRPRRESTPGPTA